MSHCFAALWMMIVTIHPANRDPPAVNANLAVLYADAPKTSY
ncbi:MAG: hypothetical protein ACKOE7_02500 [Actinomycetota bacterium]